MGTVCSREQADGGARHGMEPITTIALVLDDDSLDRLANLIARKIASEPAPAGRSGWLDAKAAAKYLGFVRVHPLHRLTAARAITFSQDADGGKLWFRQADLDEYRERGLIERR